MKQPRALLLLGVVLSSCSGPTVPAAGTFRAQLTGARSGTLSGPSNADRIFAAPFEELQFAIRMFAPRGDTVEVLVLRCAGDQPPSAGEYSLDLSGESCIATYSLVLSTEDGARLLEAMTASSGKLTIGASEPGQTAGFFTFSGTLVADSDSVGTLRADGAFSADVL